MVIDSVLGVSRVFAKLLALGAYPDVPLKRAREKRDEARKLVADGIDPSARRQAERSAAANTFKAVTDEWLATKKQSLMAATWQHDHDLLYRRVVPYIGNRPIATIEAPDLLDALKRIEAKNLPETARGRSAVGCSATRLRPAAPGATSRRTQEPRESTACACHALAANQISRLKFLVTLGASAPLRFRQRGGGLDTPRCRRRAWTDNPRRRDNSSARAIGISFMPSDSRAWIGAILREHLALGFRYVMRRYKPVAWNAGDSYSR